MDETYDVIVVGGGLCGLTAALRCQQAGLSVVVLEGRDRLGGRSYTKTETWQGKPTWFDFGAHFIGHDDRQKDIWDLVKELGLKGDLFPQYEGPEQPGEKFDGQAANLLSVWNANQRATTAYVGTIFPDSLLGTLILGELIGLLALMDQEGLNHFWQKGWYDDVSVLQWVDHQKENGLDPPPEVYSLIDMLCRVGFSAPANEISMLWFLYYISSSGGLDAFTNLRYPSQGAQGYRLRRGTQSIAETLGERLRAKDFGAIRYGKKVTMLDFSGDPAVAICADGSRHTGRAVLVATSPQLANAIKTNPALPAERHDAAAAMRNGQTVMTLCHFKTPFWRSLTSLYTEGKFNGKDVDDISANGLSGNAMLSGAPIVWTMDNVSDEGAPAMFAFVVADEALKWKDKSPRVREETVRDCLVALYGEQAKTEMTGYEEYLWTTDPFALGCPAGHFGPGDVLKSMKHILLEYDPQYMGGRLRFASSESASLSNGYMSGAVWSGKTVAERIIKTLKA